MSHRYFSDDRKAEIRAGVVKFLDSQFADDRTCGVFGLIVTLCDDGKHQKVTYMSGCMSDGTVQEAGQEALQDILDRLRTFPYLGDRRKAH